jgi:magnesium transporter
MSDSPRSEVEETRFSTPVSELDDHRGQFATLPLPERHSPPNHGTRRGTAASAMPAEHPDLLGVNEALQLHGMSFRDFEENAIVEDDEMSPYPRRGSNASPVARRNTFLRPREEREERNSNARSTASCSSSRSSSVPNSVDAFAPENRRRGRAGTLTSRAPSDLNLSLHRTVSGGTHRRRPTFSEGNAEVEGDADYENGSVQEDVCFPVPEVAGRAYQYDFEELDEFIALPQERTPVVTEIQKAETLARRGSVSSRASRPKVFHDLRPKVAKDDTLSDSGINGIEETKDVDEKNTDSTTAANAEGYTNTDAQPVTRFSFFSTELDDSIHAAELHGLLMPGESFRDLFQLSPDGGVWWLDVNGGTEEEVKVICKTFGVHQLTREDILTGEMREKVELFNGYYFVCFRSFYQDKESEEYLEPVNVYAISFRGEGLLTFTFDKNPHATNVRKRISKLRDYIAMSSDWICYALM